MKKIIGFVLMFLLFTSVFIAIAIGAGFWGALLSLGLTVLIVGLVFLTTWLIDN